MWRRSRKPVSLYKQTAPFGVRESRDRAALRLHGDEVRVIREVHDYIWRTRHSCQLCRGARSAECAGLPDQMHEDPPRSATRGRSPGERFNLICCARLCVACHRDVTERRLAIEFADPNLGFMGAIRGVRTR